MNKGHRPSKIPVLNRNRESKEEESVVTIYCNAVKDGMKRISTSSEDCDADTSDKQVIPIDVINDEECDDEMIDQFIADQRRFLEQQERTGLRHEEPQPSTSRGQPRQHSMPNLEQKDERGAGGRDARLDNPRRLSKQMTRQAEINKERMYEAPGEYTPPVEFNMIIDQLPKMTLDANSEYVHSAMVDENYLVLGNHVDESTKMKIVRGDYIDLSKLLPKDRVMTMDEPQRMELVTKEGHMYWVPAAESSRISNFGKWEQAFRIYANIYSKAYLHRSSELLQYSHLIHTASLSFMWDNVYRYDIDFRLHLAMFPKRSWAIILQQAWSLRLKDRLRYNNYEHRGGNHATMHQHKQDDEWGNLCKRYNRGHCTFGASCRFEHRCKYCKKFGHGMHVCRKLKQDKVNGTYRASPGSLPVQESTSKVEQSAHRNDSSSHRLQS